MMSPCFEIDGSELNLNSFAAILENPQVSLSTPLQEKIQLSEKILRKKIEEQKTIYGVNTGYGYNCTNIISPENLSELQSNLISYLSCGTGPLFNYQESKAIGLARFISISKGYSGVSLDLINHFSNILKLNYVPQIPSRGSLGASGDLIPLAYWANLLVGEGFVFDKNNNVYTAKDIFKKHNIPFYKFQPKEGLSIVNGTSAMAGLAYVNYTHCKKLIYLSSVLTSWALVALRGWNEAFSSLVNEKAKTFYGQSKFASLCRDILKDLDYESGPSYDVQKTSEFTKSALQDRYSLRCAPQIIGPFLDTLELGREWIIKEINGVSDNPVFDPDTKAALMGGNFYGGYMAQFMDYTKISLMQMADMLDRQLLLVMDTNTNNGLPGNLVNPSLKGFAANMNHGLKGLHQSASAITAEIGALCSPNSIFSRSSETHNQDKVSLGLSACKQCSQIIDLSYDLVTLYSVCLAQALDIRSVKVSGPSSSLYSLIRKFIPFVEKDRRLGDSLQELSNSLKTHSLKEFYSHDL